MFPSAHCLSPIDSSDRTARNPHALPLSTNMGSSHTVRGNEGARLASKVMPDLTTFLLTKHSFTSSFRRPLGAGGCPGAGYQGHVRELDK